MKGFINVTASDQQINEIRLHYKKVDDFLNVKPVKVKKGWWIFKDEKDIINDKAPEGTCILNMSITDHKDMAFEKDYSRDFRLIFSQLESGESVLMDQFAYKSFLRITDKG